MKIAPSTLPPFNREPAKAIKTTGAGEPKPVPPGLERVQARLQSVPAAERNAGQANATDRISRNIARYAETQAIVTPTVTAPAALSPAADSATTAPADISASTATPDTGTSGSETATA